MSNRDDQFMGWAKAVIMRMLDRHDGWIDFNEDDPEEIEAYSAILARAGYDLACHVVRNVDPAWENPVLKFKQDTDEIVSDVPDMAELPEENNTSTD